MATNAAPTASPRPPTTRPAIATESTSTNRRRIIIAIVAILVVAGLVWWFMQSRTGGETTYRLATVERGNVQQTVSATGTLGAVKTVQVGTQVSGQVSAEFADFNDHVTKGQLLARIDPTLQQQAVRDAQAQLERAQAQLRQAQQEYDRNAPLAREKFISASEFSTMQVNLDVARAGVKSAQVTLDRAKQNLSYTNIYAPINGVVVERNVDVGQTVAASLSAPQLYLIAQDLAQMQILAAVDESDISAIKAAQAVQFTVQAFPGRSFTGVVDEVRLQSKLQDNVVSYTVVVKVDNTDGKLLPGMTATVEFITGAAKNVFTTRARANSADDRLHCCIRLSGAHHAARATACAAGESHRAGAGARSSRSSRSRARAPSEISTSNRPPSRRRGSPS